MEKIHNINNFTGNQKEICYHFNIPLGRLYAYIQKTNMNFEEAVNLYLNTNGLILKNHKEKIYTINEFTGTKKEICEHFGILKGTVNSRIRKKNMNFEEVINYYIKNGTHKFCKDNHPINYTINGFYGNQSQICKHFGLKENTVYVMMKRKKKTFEEIVKYYINKNNK